MATNRLPLSPSCDRGDLRRDFEKSAADGGDTKKDIPSIDLSMVVGVLKGDKGIVAVVRDVL